MAILTRDQILNVSDDQMELVPVPEWNGEVWVKGMTGILRDKFESSIVSYRGPEREVNMANARAKLAASSICDEKGVLCFSEKDVKLLGGKSAKALQRVFEVAQRLSGITDTALDQLTEGLKESPLEDLPTA